MTGSNYSIIQLLAFSGIGLVLFAISLLLGLFLYNVKSNNPLRTYFLNSFLGLFTLVCIYSFCIVGFKTINVVIFIVLIYLFAKAPNRFKIEKLDFKALFPVLYIFPLVIILYGCYSLPKSIENDVRYYAKIASGFTLFKQENLYHFYNSYDSGFNGVMPYHYNEMWLTSLFSSIFKTKSIVAIKYFTYPFLISLIAYGVIGLFNGKRFLFFLLFICLSLLPFHLVSVFGSGFTVYTDFWLRPNFIIYYYLLIPLFYFIQEKNWKQFYLFAIIACANSIVIVPCLFGAAFILSAGLLYKKEINRKEFLGLNSLLFTAGLIMGLIYSIFAPSINLLTGHSFIDVISESLHIWKAVIFTIITVSVECGILIFLAFLIYKYIIKVEKLKWIFFFILTMVFIGVLLFQALNQLDNSYQFPYFAFSASGFILIIMILFAVDKVNNGTAKIILSAFILCFCTYLSKGLFDIRSLAVSLENKNLMKNDISETWIKNAKLYFEKNPNAKGGFVLSKNDLLTLSPKSRNCLTLQMGSFISYFTDNCNLPSLTCADTLLSDENKKNKKLFSKAEAWVKAFPKYTHECDVNEYIRKGEFDFIICSNTKNDLDSTFFVIGDSESKYKLVGRK